MINKVLVTIILLLVLAVGVYFLFSRNGEVPPADSEDEQAIVPTPQTSTPEGWETTTSEEVGVTVSYPNDAQVLDMQGALTLLLLGPAQVEGTEIYDGFSVTFTTGSFTENSLEDFVNSQYESAEDDLVVDNVSEIETVMVSNRNGYQFTQRGLGEFTLIYLPREENRYLQVSILVEDPGNLGFQQTIKEILSTIIFE
jgi:hypothetical protein